MTKSIGLFEILQLLCLKTTSYFLLQQSHTHFTPLLKTSAFPVSPIMQEQGTLLPGSQAGEEGTAVWSQGACRFTPTPPHSLHFSLPLSVFSLSISLMSLTFSLLLSPLSFYLPHRPTQTHTLHLLQDKAHTQTNMLCFLTGGRMFP